MRFIIPTFSVFLSIFIASSAYAADGMCKMKLSLYEPGSDSIVAERSYVEKVVNCRGSSISECCIGQAVEKLDQLFGFPLCWEDDNGGHGFSAYIEASGFIRTLNGRYIFQSSLSDLSSCPL